MHKRSLIRFLTIVFSDLNLLEAWGETSLFYNPHNTFERGKYIFTFKEKDGENDKGSSLNRDTVNFRLNMKISQKTFKQLFSMDCMPARPLKGCVSDIDLLHYDAMALDIIMPHPVYAWMSWICILNPCYRSVKEMLQQGYLHEAYANGVKLAKISPSRAPLSIEQAIALLPLN